MRQRQLLRLLLHLFLLSHGFASSLCDDPTAELSSSFAGFISVPLPSPPVPKQTMAQDAVPRNRKIENSLYFSVA
jgi:hypothetical protein